MMSVDADARWMYREVAVIAARQNGKSKILMPRIKWALEAGRRIIHTAQNGKLPRQVFLQLAGHYQGDPEAYIRRANGQEEIRLPNGGSYMIIAPQRGARGLAADDLVIDELREMEDFEFIAAAEPTLAEIGQPAGHLPVQRRHRAEPRPQRPEAARRHRPAPGLPRMECRPRQGASTIRAGLGAGQPHPGPRPADHRAAAARCTRSTRAAGELGIFETEHLCRWVRSLAPSLVSGITWHQAAGEVSWPPARPVHGHQRRPRRRAGVRGHGLAAGATAASRSPSWATSTAIRST